MPEEEGGSGGGKKQRIKWEPGHFLFMEEKPTDVGELAFTFLKEATKESVKLVVAEHVLGVIIKG